MTETEKTLLNKVARECCELAAVCMKAEATEIIYASEIMDRIAGLSLAILNISDCEWYDEKLLGDYITKRRKQDGN